MYLILNLIIYKIFFKIMYLPRFDVLELKLLSCTDIECLWKKHKEPVSEQFKALPIDSFCCINPDMFPRLPEATEIYCRNSLIACDPETGLAKSRYNTLFALNYL